MFFSHGIRSIYVYTHPHMYVRTYTCVSKLYCFYTVAPSAITAIEVNEICTNDFTVSWTPASNEEGLSYNVTLLLQSGVIFISDLTINTSYNLTGLTPNTNYSVSIASVLNSCTGTPNTIMITTVTVEAGVPQSKLRT